MTLVDIETLLERQRRQQQINERQMEEMRALFKSLYNER